MMHRTIRLVRPADRPAIETFYAHYVRTSTFTYQEEQGIDAERAAWFAAHGERHPITVVERDETILGWASMGFARVAHLKQVGHKFGRWLDVIYLQRMLTPQDDSR